MFLYNHFKNHSLNRIPYFSLQRKLHVKNELKKKKTRNKETNKNQPILTKLVDLYPWNVLKKKATMNKRAVSSFHLGCLCFIPIKSGLLLALEEAVYNRNRDRWKLNEKNNTKATTLLIRSTTQSKNVPKGPMYKREVIWMDGGDERPSMMSPTYTASWASLVLCVSARSL